MAGSFDPPPGLQQLLEPRHYRVNHHSQKNLRLPIFQNYYAVLFIPKYQELRYSYKASVAKFLQNFAPNGKFLRQEWL